MNWKVENFLYQNLKKRNRNNVTEKKTVDNYLEQLVFGAFEN